MEKFGIQIFSLSHTLAIVAHHHQLHTDSGFHYKTLSNLYKTVIDGMSNLVEQLIGVMGRESMNQNIIIYDVNQYKGLTGVTKLLTEIIEVLRSMSCNVPDLLSSRDNFVNDLNKLQFLLKHYK